MIIVEIKTRKQLIEAPLLDLIDVSDNKSKIIGTKGMKADSEGFKKTTIGLYKNSRQNLVLVLPSKEILKKITLYHDLGESTFGLDGVKPTAPIISDLLKTKGLNPSSVHVLIPLSSSFENDFDNPLWAMVHDIIGHSLQNDGNIYSDQFFGDIEIFDVEEGFKPYLIMIGRALYAGVNEKFQAAGAAVKDDLSPDEISELEYDELFNPEPPLFDDRWADILAAIALNEYDERKVVDYLNAVNSPNWLYSSMKKFITALRQDVEAASLWEPGFTTYVRSW